MKPMKLSNYGTSKGSKYIGSIAAECLFYMIILGTMLTFAFLQPFGEPPDEVARFKIPQFIANHGYLPTGDEFEVAIGGYGGSYAFQPILPYIFQGYLLRILKFTSFFALHPVHQLLAARITNVIFGMVTAYFVRKLSKELFSSPWSSWLFCILVMFLPQHLFLHSYVNTDSMAMMSGSIILYACVLGWKNGWARKTNWMLGLGLTFCILSYYNAYGLVIMAFFFYVGSYLRDRSVGNAIPFRMFLSTGIWLLFFLFLTCGWWFIRNAMIHDGDFLGLYARSISASRTALPDYNPSLRQTLAGSNVPLSEMLFHMDFTFLLWQSFVASFGPMTITTLPWLYIWYYRLFRIGWILCLLPSRFSEALPFKSGHKTLLSTIIFDLSMLTGILIPIVLCVYYSYTSDYQPQGRYIMPMLLPFMFFITLGISKCCVLLQKIPTFRQKLFHCCTLFCLYLLPILFFTGALILTMLKVVIPFYTTHPNLWTANWISF